jgi:RecA-family ATPase
LYLAFGTFAVIDGPPGIGKSTLCNELAARLSTGGTLPDGTKCEAARVLILSGEDSAESTIVPRLKVAGADSNKIVLVHDVKDEKGVDSHFMIPEHTGAIRDKIIETHAKLVVIDSLMAYLSPKLSANYDQDVRRALKPLRKIAEETGALILVVRHLNEQGGKQAIYRGGGSVGIIGGARTAWIVGRTLGTQPATSSRYPSPTSARSPRHCAIG